MDAEIEAMIQGDEQQPLTPTSALRKLLKPAMLAEEEVGTREASGAPFGRITL